MIETYRGVVYPNQLDHMDHMNVQWYTSKFDGGTWHLFSAVGITSDYIRKTNRGMAAVEQITKYKAEAMSGDLLVVNYRSAPPTNDGGFDKISDGTVIFD